MSNILMLSDNLSKDVAKFHNEEGSTCQHMWSHGCQMCDFNGYFAVQTLCIAKN